MIKLSQEEQEKLARCVGVAAAFFEYGYSEESIKLAFEQSLPDGIVKEAFWGTALKGLFSLGKGIARGVSRQAIKGYGRKGIQGALSKGFAKAQRGLGTEFMRWGARPGQAAWETGKGIVGNMIFPGLVKSKSLIGKGVGTGLFAKSMLGGMGGGAPPPQPARFGY